MLSYYFQAFDQNNYGLIVLLYQSTFWVHFTSGNTSHDVIQALVTCKDDWWYGGLACPSKHQHVAYAYRPLEIDIQIKLIQI